VCGGADESLLNMGFSQPFSPGAKLIVPGGGKSPPGECLNETLFASVHAAVRSESAKSTV
jgi:hypothetical protein